jgi:polyisoprenoid-binding protein YceI
MTACGNFAAICWMMQQHTLRIAHKAYLMRFIPAAMTVMVLASSPVHAAESLKINPQKTRITFEVDAVGWPTTKGVFKAFEGDIRVDFREPSKSLVVFKVQATSLDAGSSAVSNFVKSESMLNVAKYSEMRFRSSTVEKLSENAVRVTGPMTFMGETRPASFLVDVDQRKSSTKQFGFTARGTIKRSEFGLISGQPLISDDVRIAVTTEAEIQ